MATFSFPTEQTEDLPLTVEDHHAVLCAILKLHATKWREIGLHLGFLPGDLDNIQGAPLLLQTAPVSWMNAMLQEFLKAERSPVPRIGVLETALKKAGLGTTASQLRDNVQQLQAQGVPKLNLSPVHKYAERLKQLYSKRKMPDYLKGRQLRTAKFVSLALISREGVSKKEMDEFTRATVQDGDIDMILMKKAPLELRQIGKHKDGSLATCMLLQGGSGVGKTTLAWNLCREWESGELFQEFSLVIFVPLRRKEIREAKDIRELFLIGNSNSSTQEIICKELMSNQGESVLLVLDGYDELPEDMQEDSMIAEVVSGGLLPKANVLVTSRPSACDMLHDKCCQRDEDFQHIEVLGFTQDKIQAYIEDNIDPKELPQLCNYLISHPKILAMMHNPLQCALTIEVCKKMFEDGSGLPNTRTKLFETNVLMTISREHSTLCRRTNSLQKLPQALQKKFVKLCHLAYDGIVKRQIIFEDVPEEIKEVGLLVCEPEIDSVLPSSENYNFFHLTIQEFCAAYYICSLPEQKQTTLLLHNCKENHFREVVIFVCGMSNNPERIMDIVYSCVYKYIEDENSDSDDTDDTDSEIRDVSKEDIFLLLACAFESQCSNICSSLTKKLTSSIDMSIQNLTPSDMSALGFVICKSKHPTTKLRLRYCDCYDGIEALISQFHRTLEEHSSLSIETIDLYRNSIDDDGAKFLSEGLKYFPDLQTLSLSNNEIGDKGIECLSEQLKFCPKLQTVDLSNNEIGAYGAKCLSQRFKHCPKLQTLDLSGNDIGWGDDGVKCLSEGLKYCPKLQILDLSSNKIEPIGAKCLSEGLKYYPELQTLDLSRNNIGYIGAKYLSGRFKYCPVLQTLRLSRNSLCIGVKYLSEGLKYCPKLQSLDLSWNKISADEVNCLSKGLKHCPELETLDLSRNKIGDDGVKCLSEGLKHCRELQTLVVWENSVSDEGRAALEMMEDEMNSKQGPHEHKLKIYI